jgi:YidC/Oxa1 family membrane protein insertase
VLLAIVVIFYWPIMTKLGLVDEPKPVETQTQDTPGTSMSDPYADPAAVTQPTDYQATQAVQANQPAQTPVGEIDTTAVDTLTIETGKYTIKMSTFGGGPISIELKDYSYRDGRPIQMLPDLDRVTPEATFQGGTFTTSRVHFACSRQAGSYDVSGEPLEIVYTYNGAAGGTISRTYTFYSDRYSFDFKLDVDQPSVFGFDRDYKLMWNTALEPTEPNVEDDWVAMQAAAVMAGSREALDDFDDGRLRQTLSGRTAWAGVRSKYFSAVLIPRSREAEGAVAEGIENDVTTADGMMEERRITAGLEMTFATVNPISDDFTVYVGPLDYMDMRSYDVALEDMLDIGTSFLGKLIYPFAFGVLWLLPKLYSVLPNYGLVIILFALMVKIVTLPLSMKQFKSMQAMKELQPRIDELKKRHKKDAQKLNKETMKLYKAEGVSPLSGCLPMLPQMPLFFAMFSVFRQTILLRDAPFFWFIDDLSRGATGLMDPYIILVLLMIASQFISQKITMPSNQQNKMLGYMMPLFMGFIFYSFAAGLVLYWTAFSIMAMLDYALFKRPKNPEIKTS